MSLFDKVNNLHAKLKSSNANVSSSQSESPRINQSEQINSPNAGNGAVVNRPRTNTDPQTCFEVFKSHWSQAWVIISKVSNTSNTVGQSHSSNNVATNRSPQQEVDTVLRYVDQMMLLLVEEEDQDGAQGPILQYMLEEDLLTKLFQWSNLQLEYADRLKYHHLKTVDLLISQARQLLLVHKPIIRPLLQLLTSCEEHPNSNIEQHLILVLHQLCVAVTQNTHLLELLFSASSDQGSAKFLIFSLLIPYIHHEGSIGQQARDALLLIMALSSRLEHIGQYIAQHSDFCPVLATGLSGLYSSLPRKLDPPADDWYQITQEDLNKCQALLMFMNSLEFCNAVVQVSHPLVAEQLLQFILQGFLIPVMGPALHQNDIILQDLESQAESLEDADSSFLLDDQVVNSDYKSSMEEVIAATAYLDLFIRRITEPALLCVFIRFVIAEKYDDVSILDSLIARIQSSSRLCMVTLSLFKTLVDLNCEDIMFQLIFRYLIPCTHVMVSQKRAVRDLDLYGKTAEKLLSLKPHCCSSLLQDNNNSGSKGAAVTIGPGRSREGSMSSQGSPQLTPVSTHTSFSFTSSNTPNVNIGTPKKRLWRNFGKNTSLEQMSTSSSPVPPPSPSPSLRTPRQVETPRRSLDTSQQHLHSESHYMDYLAAAHVRIVNCATACASWGAPYDGENPSPDSMVFNANTTVADESMFNVTHQQVHTGDSSNTVVGKVSVTVADTQDLDGANLDKQGKGLVNSEGELMQPDKVNSIERDQISSCDKTLECNTVNEQKDVNGVVTSQGASETSCDDSSGNNKNMSVQSSQDVDTAGNGGNDLESGGETGKMNSACDRPNQLQLDTSTAAIVADAESVVSEADSGLSGSSTNTEHTSMAINNSINSPVSRSDSPLSDNFDSGEFNSFLLSLKRVPTPVEFSDSMEACLNEIDVLVTEYKKLETVRKTSSSSSSSVTYKSTLRNSQSEFAVTPSPSEDRTFEKSLFVTSPSFSMDLSKSGMTSETSMPKSMSLDSMSLAAVSPMKSAGINVLSLNQSVAPIFTPTKYNLGKPDIGPFLTTLLSKLEAMMQNSLYVNLLLTGLVTRLACYHQPLLRSFLLNQTLVFQPTVKSLVQVLSSVRHKVDNYAYTVKDFDTLLVKARHFLQWREEEDLVQNTGTRGRSDSNLSLLSQTSPRLMKKKKSTFGDFFRSKPKKPPQPNIQLLQTGKGFRYFNRTDSPQDSEENPLEALKTKNAVYCAVVLDEFLKELAALSQEHAVLSVSLVHSNNLL